MDQFQPFKLKPYLLIFGGMFILTSCSTGQIPAPPVEESSAVSIPASGSTAPTNAIELSESQPLTSGINGATAPLLDGIGPLEFPISTDAPLAQKYFNQALTLAFGFNHAEAVRSFKEAARLDPTCGICYAGAALALGPNINAPMTQDAVGPAWSAVQQALALRQHENAKEKAYIDAIATRYSKHGKDRKTLDVVYAGSIAGLVEAYPDDLHARTLHAEALMDLMPWEYWNDDGTPANQNTVTLVKQLETVLAADPNHPGAAHLYIHAMERFEPAKAEAAADRLGPLVPVAGHLVHMPSHIYLRVGRYADAVAANTKAAMADEDYIAQCNAQGLYPAAYYPHNIHFLWYSAMMEGRKAMSVENGLKLAERVPVDVAAQMGALQSYIAVPVYTYVRFGMWEEVLSLHKPAANLPFTRAMYHYGRGLAQAAVGNIQAAQQERSALLELAASEALQNMTMRRPGVTSDLLGIAQSLVTARIKRHQGDTDAELAALQQAVAFQDALPYSEPPLWHYPVRQTLGEAQIRAGNFAGAEATFAEDLLHFPMNPWSLFGSELAKQGLGQDTQNIQQERANAWRNSDIAPAVSW
jgi:tetratricopeptide (TPR) repeat protein